MVLTFPRATKAQKQPWFPLLPGCSSRSLLSQVSSRALHSLPQPQVLGDMGPKPGQSPNFHLTHWEKAFFLLDPLLEYGLDGGCGEPGCGHWRGEGG